MPGRRSAGVTGKVTGLGKRRRRPVQADLPLDPTAAAVALARAATTSKRERPEGELLDGVRRFIAAVGGVCWRENAGVVVVGGHGGQRKGVLHLAPIGQPDVTALLPHNLWHPPGCGCWPQVAIPVLIETKAPGEQVRLAQAMRHERLKQVGALILLVRSVKDLRDQLLVCGLKVP